MTYVRKTVVRYLHYIAFSMGGYIDIYACNSNTGLDHFVQRVNRHQHVPASNTDGLQYPWPVAHAVLAVYFLTRYPHIKTYVRIGGFYLTGLGFKTGSESYPTMPYAHSDNVFGDPNSLSDRGSRQTSTN